MVAELKQHIELRGDDPLDAVIAGTSLKAYLVANLAFNDSPEESAKHYGLSLSSVYAAMAFRHDNAEALQQADAEAMRKLRDGGMRDIDDVLRGAYERESGE